MNIDEIMAACGADADSFDVGVTTEAVRRSVRDLAAMGDTDAERWLDQMEHNGAREVVKKWSKSKTQLLVSHLGEVIGINRMRSVKRATKDGIAFQQSLVHVMTWTQFFAMLESAIQQRGVLNAKIGKLSHGRELYSRHPETVGPDEAAAMEGRELDDILANGFAA